MPTSAVQPVTPPWADSAAPNLDVDSFVDEHGPLESGGPSWTITSDGAAEWAMAHVAAATAQVQAIRDQRCLWQDQLDRWSEDALRGPQRTVLFFAEHLQRYAVAVRALDKNRKTLALPSGRVPTADHQPQVVIINDDELIAWAETCVYSDPSHPPHAELGVLPPTLTFADLGVVKVTKEARISELRKLVIIQKPKCELCAGEGSVVDELHDGSERIDACSRCDGRGYTFTVTTLTGEVVPGVDVDPGGLSAGKLQPVRPVTL